MNRLTAMCSGITLAVLVAALPAQAANQNASWNRDLRVGSSGQDVAALQEWLISEGFSINGGATGYFGGQTQAALARFQASTGIYPAAGYFGPMTRAKVGEHKPAPKPESPKEDKKNESQDISIRVELSGGKAYVKVVGDADRSFTLLTINRARIVREIADRLDMTERDVKEIIKYSTTRRKANVETSAKVTYTNGADSDTATYVIAFDLSAVNQNVYIARDPAVSVDYRIEDGEGNIIASQTSRSANLQSTADTQDAYYVVREGDSERMTFTVVFDPLATDEGKFLGLQLLSVRFNDTAAAPDQTWNARPMNTYRTDFVTIPD